MINFTKLTSPRTVNLCLAIIITGISAGIFSAAIIPRGDKTMLFSLLQFHFASNSTAIIPYLLTNGLLLGIIVLACFSIYGFPLALAVLICRSFSCGFCGFILLDNIEKAGFMSFTFRFFLPNLFFLSIYLAASIAGTTYALQNLHRNT